MLHHFSLTFRLPGGSGPQLHELAERLPGSDFTLEPAGPHASGEFTAHFSREGESVTAVLEEAREQVQGVLGDAQLVGMDLTEEPPPQAMVDDITKLVFRACNRLGGVEAARAWLATPKTELDGLTPKALMVDAEGRLRVSRLLQATPGPH